MLIHPITLFSAGRGSIYAICDKQCNTPLFFTFNSIMCIVLECLFVRNCSL